jgi:hypothetical protein
MTLNMGDSQGCMHSLLLYSLYTHDCVASHSSNSIKFSDNTTLVGLITNNDETSYMEEGGRYSDHVVPSKQSLPHR